ncbi:DUF4232 domain-containing protein [Streptomyces sp. NPDC088785]|uniref:DUF4232 domain-containing protein n=1 Tax=Streptomyces sp. NPDC088785 TaxID=3365897 RepID=UPI00380FC994
MKSTRITALAAVSLAAALSLTACGGDGSGTDASAAKGSSSSASSSSKGSATSTDRTDRSTGSSSSGSDATSSDGSGSASGQGAGIGTAAKGATRTSSRIAFCRTADLAIDAVDAAPDKNSGRIDITMVNRGSTTCSATGFAGVDIKDADHTSNPIGRGPAQPRITTLKPGDAAVFDLAYTIDGSGDSLSSPTDILVTPPNETHTVTLDWPAGAGDIKGAYTDVQVYPTHTTH